MAEGIIRFAPHREPVGDKLIEHTLGRDRPASAYVRPHLGLAAVPIAEDLTAYAASCERAAAGAAAQRGGKRPHLAVSWLFTGGPATDEVHRDESTIPPGAPATLAEGRPWTLADCRRFGEVSIGMLREAAPDAGIIGSVHLDEKMVHVQAESSTYNGGKVGLNSLREGLAALASGYARENAKAYARAKAKEAKAAALDEATAARGEEVKARRRWVDRGPGHCYLSAAVQARLMHDAYAERVAELGISRGAGASAGRRRHHEHVDAAKAMDARSESVQRSAAIAIERRRTGALREIADRKAVVAGNEAAVRQSDELTAKVIQQRLVELAALDEQIGARRAELGLLERCADLARRLGAGGFGGVVGVLREEFALDGVQLSPRMRSVLDGCQAQNSPAPVLESRRARELHAARSSGRGEARRD